jgi:hypothetical protein
MLWGLADVIHQLRLQRPEQNIETEHDEAQTKGGSWKNYSKYIDDFRVNFIGTRN